MRNPENSVFHTSRTIREPICLSHCCPSIVNCSYVMKALRTEKLLCCCTFRDLVAELPFILMHPKPEEDPPLPITARPSSSHELGNREGGDDVTVDTNLIQLDT